MLIFSILFYKERIILVDTANGIFNIVKDHSFAIGIYRFGNVLTQIFPVAAIKADAPLDVVMICYSAGYIVYYFACYFICGRYFRRYDLAIVMLLLNILFAAHTFFWIPSELPQGMALFVLILAAVHGKGFLHIGIGTWIVVVGGVITLVFFHPLIVFPVVYAIAFFLLRKETQFDKKWLLTIGWLYFLIVLLKAVFFRTPYERHSMSWMKNFITFFQKYITLYSNKQFLIHCVTIYYSTPFLLLSIILTY